MENTPTFCDQLNAILLGIPTYSESAVAGIDSQHQLYDTLLHKHLDSNAHIKKHMPVCYDIGLNIGRAKNEKVAKKQQFWFDKARDDFRSDIKALKQEMNCGAPAPGPAPTAAPAPADDLDSNWS